MENELKTYICSMCGEEFQSDRSDEDALEEMYDNNWGDIPLQDMGIACDTCYQSFMAWYGKKHGN